MATPTQQNAPRRRWRRLGLGALLLLGAIAAAGPGLASRWARGRIERSLSVSTGGQARVGRLDFAWNGVVTLADLELTGEGGELIALVHDARFDLGIRSLLTGKKDVALAVRGAHLELVQDESGNWNIGGAGAKGTEDRDPAGDDRKGLPATPPDLEGRLELHDTIITVRSPRSVLELRDIDLLVGLDGDKREYSVLGGGSLAGSDGSAGTLSLKGALWPDASAGIRIDLLAVEGLELGAVQEALNLFGSPLPAGSRLSGELDVELSAHVDGFGAESPFVVDLTANGRDVLVDLRADGERLVMIEEPASFVGASMQRVGEGSQPHATAEFTARDGAVLLAAGWDGGARPSVKVHVGLAQAQASAGIDSLLARVHPVFASAQAIEGAGIDGLVNAQLSLVYEEALPLERLLAGDFALDTRWVGGSARFGLESGAVTASPLFTELLTSLGAPLTTEFGLSPLEVQLEGGLLRYDKPWTWNIGGSETRFEGGVGLDGALQLSWVVPVTESLGGGGRWLRPLAGEALEVPITGTLSAPRIDVQGAVAALAKGAGERAIQSELDAGKEALRDALGGGDEAGELLKRADRLWGEGKRDEAAGLYRTIRSEHSLSPAYLLNRKRIKSRRNG